MPALRIWAATIVVSLTTLLSPAAASGGTTPSVLSQLGCQDAYVTTTGSGQYVARLTATTRWGTFSASTVAQGSTRTVLNLNGLRLKDIRGVELQVFSGGVVVYDRRTVTCF